MVVRGMAFAVALAALAPVTVAAQTLEAFYKGKDIKVLIGAGVGGTYGLYAQLAARHMRQYVPGQPVIILQAMPGAGGIVALNYSANAAPKDGSMMHLVHAEVLFETLMKPDSKFNARTFQYIGRFADADSIGLVSRQSGIRSLDQVRQREITMGSTGRDTAFALGPLMLNRFGGTKFKVIAGYKGTADIHIAMQRGEVDGAAVTLANAQTIQGAALKSGELVPIFAIAEKRIPDYPDVPTVTEFGRDTNEKAFLEIYTSSGTIGRALAFPPGVPKPFVQALRDAFDKTIVDKEFLAEAQKTSTPLAPMSGEKLAAYVDKLMATPPEQVAAARKINQELMEEP
ncbi:MULTISPECIES: tripartite tricarboxylate transporter substrate-binding protein [unclassified Beijerinckia]|uniref:tripartite tricarboxylate transporter substrate-binding protein n=1 Tax=unclassified Beijerinckia TaxID=2638183 RepID=UPI0008990BAB|nr:MULTISPECIES: tripartite tricarboxylate transporter substrate-binding protein [unclassified Beijerinckia]MDH7795203.1 tripartite-type tricarboxylate transporter receptor subunit TctC [Beijerinckia sp. GAS462]SEB91883.1 Tripartite-type tricarboxylate transporter, receptor component TctC [Beijerinckia sp. 28-YEA-48]